MNKQEVSMREKMKLLTDFFLTKEAKETFKSDQDEILIEEMAELTTAIKHYKRNKCGKEKIIEELSHVLISLECLRKMLNISNSDIEEEIQKKLDKYKIYKYYYDNIVYKSENFIINKQDNCYIVIPYFSFDKDKLDKALKGTKLFYQIYDDFIIMYNFGEDILSLLNILKNTFQKI